VPQLATIILAAGKGTRMKSDRAKVLHDICGRPMIHFPVRLALKLGAAKAVLVIGHQGELVRAEITAAYPKKPISFAWQREQKGTGHAVLQAKRALKGFEGQVLILSGDVPLLTPETLREMRRAHKKAKAGLTVLTTYMDDPTGYGRCVVDREGHLLRIVEHKDATPHERDIDEVNSGIYLVDAKLLWSLLRFVGADNSQGEMYLTDIVALANEAGEGVFAYAIEDSVELLGINSRAELAEASDAVRQEANDGWMRGGVTMIDPFTTYLDLDVKVGSDTVIEPGAYITGTTRIGKGCIIGLGARLHNARIVAGQKVPPHTVIVN
jgi:bifunctional UDP-N-acetylglucosamine pyrophosphorylase / glucosamine-1-phosphate N-acetyltransferase